MKILLLVEGLTAAAGTERIATEVANALAGEGHQVRFAICSSSPSSYFPLADGIQLHGIAPSFGLRHRLKAIRGLRRLIRELRPDVLVNVAIPMGQISLPAFIGLRHRPAIVAWEHFSLNAGSKLGYWFRIASALACTRTIVLTDADRNSYPRWCRGKVMRIYNFSTIGHTTLSPLDANVVLSIGRLNPQKQFDALLRAWARVGAARTGWTLRIVGNGKEKETLARLADELGITDSTEFRPATPQIADHYREAAIYVMSSRYEGLPMVLIEAKCFGLPCVSFDCPNGSGEIIRHDTDGLLVTSGDVEGLAAALRRLMTDRKLIRQFGKAANDDAQQRFSRGNVIVQWEQLLTKITSR